jgi:DNA polymerase-1
VSAALEEVSFYSQHTVLDPTRRAYLGGELAVTGVVRMAAEAGRVAVDIETAGLGDLAFTVKAIIISNHARSYVLDGSDPRHRMAARDAMAAATTLVFHNSAFDVPPLVSCQAMCLADIDKVDDTLIYARMALTAFGDGRKLTDLEQRYLVHTGILRAGSKDRFAAWAKANGMAKGDAFARLSYGDPIYMMYAGWDAILTHLAWDPVQAHAMAQLTHHPFGRYGADTAMARELLDREQRVNRIMLKRSARGIAIDDDRIAREQDRLAQERNAHDDVLKEHGITDPSNREQLGAVLEAVLPNDYPHTPTGKVSTAAANLAKIDHPAVHAFVAYDELRRLHVYLEQARLVARATDGRIHPQVNVHHARTGRTSYSNPALQQFTEDARRALVSDPGREWTSIDWTAIEPIIAANLSQDTGPIAIYESGGDVYQGAAETADVVRKVAKVVVLAMLYGEGLRSLAHDLATDLDGARTVRTRIASAMPRSDRLVRWAPEWAAGTGKTWTLSGRIIDVDRDRAYKAANYLVQGSAYDVLAEAMVRVDEAGLADAIQLTLHDEMIVDTEAATDIRRIMEQPPPRLVELAGRTPILRTDRADLGPRWETPE